jgi:hypothetical protein
MKIRTYACLNKAVFCRGWSEMSDTYGSRSEAGLGAIVPDPPSSKTFCSTHNLRILARSVGKPEPKRRRLSACLLLRGCHHPFGPRRCLPPLCLPKVFGWPPLFGRLRRLAWRVLARHRPLRPGLPYRLAKGGTFGCLPRRKSWCPWRFITPC